MNIKHLVKEYNKLKQADLSFTEVYKLCKSKHRAVETTLFNKKVKVNNAFWYLHGLKELFIDESYKFYSATSAPIIIDCGANVGLSVMYFKSIFPRAKITAFEPDQNIFSLLTSNINEFGYADVNLINKAVWIEDGGIEFLASGGVGGRICHGSDSNTIQIPTVRLKNLLQEKVDFLKIDIEGAEFDVIEDCKDNLVNVNNLFIEYHSLEEKEQKLDEILKILKLAGFKYYIKEAWENQLHPYTNKRVNLFDLQLNIFAYRLGS